jgi:hypothetical protein
MLKRSAIVDRLLAHSIIFEEAAGLSDDDDIAFELERLAACCLNAAIAIIGEMPPLWKH